ncbi:hypothetical protein [Thalassotalea agarivorans]|nr:hypothetical protein [Thalassotalea agarivorans]
MAEDNNPFIDRRTSSPDSDYWWSRLSLAQKFSASNLGKFGYELAFIRNMQQSSQAVLLCAGGIAVVTDEGEIDTSPNIQLR